MPKPQNDFAIHQALHGYDSGHRLLESSTSFEPPDERTLLIMSDLSGPRLVEGFLEYITAYPLPTRKYYVIAKTWYATEMERPGCVWTHSLFVKSEQIGRIKNALPLLNIFQRPNVSKTHDYSLPVSESFDASSLNIGPVREAPNFQSFLQHLIQQLYEGDLVPVAFPAESGVQFEKLALLIWSQQWPALRLNFSLCTGSLSERTLGSRLLDLQFGPSHVIRNFRIRDYISTPSTWPKTILSDLLEGTETPLRDFIGRVAEDLTNRSDFPKLIAIHDEFIRMNVRNMLEQIQISYPNREQGRSLKRVMAGEASPLLLREDETLSSLVELPSSDGFDVQELEIRNRALKFLERNRPAALEKVKCVLNLARNPMRDNFVGGLANSLAAADFEKLADPDPQVLVKLALIQPDLTYRDEFWGADFAVESKVDVFRQLNARQRWKSNFAIESLLRTGNSQTGALIAGELKEEHVETVLNCVSRNEKVGSLLRPEWLAFFHTHQAAVVTWYSDRQSFAGHLVILLAQVVDPFSTAERLSLRTLTALCETAKKLFSNRDEVAAFIYVAGSRHVEPEAAFLVVSTFPTLHTALEESRLSHRAWEIVSPLLPSLDEWWNYCEKLRRSIFLLFQSRSWPVGSFWQLIQHNDHFFSEFLRTAKYFPDGREVFSKVLEGIRADRIFATKGQVKSIKKLVD